MKVCKIISLLVVIGLLFCAAGCSGKIKKELSDAQARAIASEERAKNLEADISKLKKQIAQLESENANLKEQIKQLGGGVEGSNAAQQAASEPIERASFEDIKGVFGEKEILDLARLGVFDSTEGKFEPHKSVTRAEFVRWLVKANNAINAKNPGKIIRLAEGGKSTFKDVSPVNPDFKYIQGMANSGFVIGYDSTTFKPDRPLTREEMIAIKIGVDMGERDKKTKESAADRWGWNDGKDISDKYATNIYWDAYCSADNIKRTFGSLKSFRPKEKVTRAEAAVCLWKFGGHHSWESGKTAAEVLKKR